MDDLISLIQDVVEVGVVVLAEMPYAEGFGDRADLTLPASDVKLIERMRLHCKKLVVLLLSGRPLILTDQLPLMDALVAAWLPGTEGQGVADVLFGDLPFTGQLPYSWPRDIWIRFPCRWMRSHYFLSASDYRQRKNKPYSSYA